MRTFRLSVWRLIRDFVVETVELDGRLARTMVELFVRPGKLPQEFSDNRRARFVSPIRMYLFSSLLFFFLLALGSNDTLLTLEADDAAIVEFGDGAAEVELQGQVSTVGAPGAEEQIQASPDLLLPYLEPRSQQRLVALLAEPYRKVNHGVVLALSEVLEELAASDHEPGWWMRRSLVNAVAMLDDLPAYMSLIVENLPLAMFVLLPFYALLLKLLFFTSGRYYAEHLVFALYLHVVAFFVFSLSILLPTAQSGPWAVLETLVSVAAFGYLGIYTYLAMGSYYAAGASVSRWSIGWRFIALGACYGLLLIPALLLVMAFSFIGL